MNWDLANVSFCSYGFRHKVLRATKDEIVVRITCPKKGCDWKHDTTDPMKAVREEYKHMDWHVSIDGDW